MLNHTLLPAFPEVTNNPEFAIYYSCAFSSHMHPLTIYGIIILHVFKTLYMVFG